MSPNRYERFQSALGELRRRLAEGAVPAGSRLAAGALASELGLSPTPVREALARLAGEGLLEERRGDGFFLRRLSSGDVADLYDLAFAHLRIALASSRLGVPASGCAPVMVDDVGEGQPIAAADRLLAQWVEEAGSAVLVRSFHRVQLQLARVRRVEPLHLHGLADEYARLRAQGEAPPRARTPVVAAFFRRRIRVAHRLAEQLEARAAL
jgi:DNA-binding GntR family transcriptional regulator